MADRPLDGVRVVEFSTYVAAPACCGVLSDWGAEVLKVEPPGGETLRHIAKLAVGADVPHPPFVGDNRGKKSVVLDVKTPDGRDALHALIAAADVFVSNFRVAALERLGLLPETLSARHPKLVVAVLTAYGRAGPDKDRPGYDIAAFWARSGFAMNPVPPGEAPRVPSNGCGDRTTGISLAGGICAALLRRARTGRGCVVETSLLHVGAFANGGVLSNALATGKTGHYPPPLSAGQNPLCQTYKVRDDHFIELLGMTSQRHLPAMSRGLGLPRMLSDPNFSTPALRRKHRVELHTLIQQRLLQRTLAEWEPVLREHEVWYAVHQRATDLVKDPQAIAAGVFAELPTGERTYNTPIAFTDVASGRLPTAPRAGVPDIGQHTGAALQAAGVTGGRLRALIAAASAESKL